MAVFPQAPLDLAVDLLLPSSGYPAVYGPVYGSTWTAVKSFVYQRAGTSPAVSLSRGRPDETATASGGQATATVNNRDGRFTARNPTGPYYGQLNRNTPIRFSVPAAATYLRFADDTASGCSCADSTPLQVTTSLDVRIDLMLDSYAPCLLVSKWAPSNAGWAVALNSDGSVEFTCTSGSGSTTTRFTTAGFGLPIPLGRVMIRALLDITGGNLWVWTAPNMGGSQTLLAEITGTGVSALDTAAGQGVTIGNSPAYASKFGVIGMVGRVYEVQVWSASGVTDTSLLADPVFSAATAGNATYGDAQGNTWTVTGTAEFSKRIYRFHGETSSLPVTSDPSGKDVYVPLTCGGVLRRIQQGSAPVLSAMRRYLSAQAPGVVAYWPCEDGFLSGQISSGLSAGLPMTIALGTPTMAASSPAASSGALPFINGSEWIGPVQNSPFTGTLVVRFILNVGTALGGLAAADVIRIDGNGDFSPIFIQWQGPSSPSSGLAVFITIPGGQQSITTPVILPLTQATSVLVSLEILPSGGSNVVFTLRTITAAGVVSSVASSPTVGSPGNVWTVVPNPDPSNMGQTVLGHISVQNQYVPLSGIPGTVWQAWNGEKAGTRFTRLCAENGITSRVYGFPAVTQPMGPQGQGTLIQLLQECESADLGIIYEPAECDGLGYRTLASMTNQQPLVLDFAQAHLGQLGQAGEWQPIDDDLLTRNDVTVQRANAVGSQGGLYTVTLNDGSAMSVSAPPAGIGDYPVSASANVQADTQLPDLAGWLMHRGTVNEERFPALPLNLARTELASLTAAILDLRIGDYVQVVNPPAWLPPGPFKSLVYGVQEQLGGVWHLIWWQCVPESVNEVLQFDDSVHGRWDTDGSVLDAGITATATVMSVDTTTSGSPLWTTAAADFPFTVMVGGEQMTITNITGASSPQSFTVTRAVNGVTKAHNAGEDVRLWPAPVLAML